MGMGTPNHGYRQHPTTGKGETRPRVWAAPEHGHGQDLTTGTGKEEAATSMGITPQWAMGTGKHPFPWQSPIPHHPRDNGQGAD